MKSTILVLFIVMSSACPGGSSAAGEGEGEIIGEGEGEGEGESYLCDKPDNVVGCDAVFGGDACAPTFPGFDIHPCDTPGIYCTWCGIDGLPGQSQTRQCGLDAEVEPPFTWLNMLPCDG